MFWSARNIFGSPKQTCPTSRLGWLSSKVGKPGIEMYSNLIIVMETEMKRRKKPGRKASKDPAIYRYSIKLNATENKKFISLFGKSRQNNKTAFIKSMVFEHEMKVIVVDKVTKDYYMRLTNIYEQYKAIGNNYNQTVKAIKTNFAEKRGLAMLYRLEKATIQLVIITKSVIELTNEFEQKWLRR